MRSKTDLEKDSEDSYEWRPNRICAPLKVHVKFEFQYSSSTSSSQTPSYDGKMLDNISLYPSLSTLNSCTSLFPPFIQSLKFKTTVQRRKEKVSRQEDKGTPPTYHMFRKTKNEQWKINSRQDNLDGTIRLAHGKTVWHSFLQFAFRYFNL